MNMSNIMASGDRIILEKSFSNQAGTLIGVLHGGIHAVVLK